MYTLLLYVSISFLPPCFRPQDRPAFPPIRPRRNWKCQGVKPWWCRNGNRTFVPDFFSLARSHAVRHIAELFPAVRGFHRFCPELTNPHPILCWRDRLDSNQRALEALYSFQDCPIMTTLVLSQEMPVSPGCHAADSAFALSPVNDRLPHPRIPLRLDGVSWASSMGAYYWAWIRSRRAEALWPLQGIPYFSS